MPSAFIKGTHRKELDDRLAAFSFCLEVVKVD